MQRSLTTAVARTIQIQRLDGPQARNDEQGLGVQDGAERSTGRTSEVDRENVVRAVSLNLCDRGAQGPDLFVAGRKTSKQTFEAHNGNRADVELG